MKFIVLLSSGIDSPVAAYLISAYADELIFLHADVHPFNNKNENDVFRSIVKHLSNNLQQKITTYLVSHGSALKTYKKKANPRYTCIFCKRMMLRYANVIAEKEKADALVMGDSLGQVASQTLQNIQVIDEVSNLPVLRPLIGYDKEDIIKIAKKIETFSLSTIQTGSCQAVPDKPSTKARLEKIHIEEKKIAIDQLINKAVNNATITTFN